jgi:hypothetical protein
LSDSEAIVQIRGREQLAKFEDGVPSENRVTVLMNGEKDQMIHVKTVAAEPINSNTASQSTEDKVLQSVGLTGKESPSIKQAVQILLDKGAPISKDIVNGLKEFMDTAKGTVETKIETVKALANKRLDATYTQLRAIHEALHGKPLNEVLTDIAKEIDPNFKMEKAEPTSVKQQEVSVPKESASQNVKAIESQSRNTSNESIVLPKNPAGSNELSELVRKSRELVEKEPDLKKAIQQIREEIVKNPKIDRELTQKIEKAASEAEKLQIIGKDRLIEALKNAEAQLHRKEQQSQTTISSNAPKVLNDNQSQTAKLADIVKELKGEVIKNPNINQSIEKVREQLVENPRIPKEIANKLSQAVSEAASLAKQGRMTTGKDVLSHALSSIQGDVEAIDLKQNQVSSAVRPSEAVKEAQAEVQRDPNFQRVIEKVRDQVVSHPKMDQEVARKIEKALSEAVQLQKTGQESAGRDRVQQVLAKAEAELKQIEARQSAQPAQGSQPERNISEVRPSEAVKEAKAEVQRDPNFQRVIEKVRDQVISHPKMDQEVAGKIEKALNEAAQLQKIGQEPIGRERIQQALAKAEIELKQLEARQPVQTPQGSQPAQVTQGSQSQEETQLPKQEAQMRETIKQIREQIQSETDPKKILQKIQEQIINNKKIDPEIIRNIERLANQANQLDQAGRERLTKMLQQVETILKQHTTQTNQTENSINTNLKDNQQQNSHLKNSEMPEQSKIAEIRPSDSIKLALKLLQKEPNLEQALSQVRKEITSNPNINLKTIDKAEQALERAGQLQDKGRELAARQHITKELTEIEQDLAKAEPKSANDQKITQDMQYDLNEQLQSLNIQSKDILVTKVTQKLAQATHDFRELKREISKNLDTVERLIDTYKRNAYPQAKQMLETAISKLDNAILKSEMMLFTDMRTEKQLMQASTQLAEAKKLLAKGDHAEAGKIVNEVKSLVDKLIFKPSEQKIMHFVNKESMAFESRSPSQQMLSQFGDTARGLVNQEPSARQMFEMVRSLGLNHDSDVANSLVFQKNDQSQQEQQQQQNLKAALLKLTQGEEANTKVGQQAEQALTNLTGQQLLSKSDASGTLQSMFFNLPMLLGGKPENLQVFVNSKSEGQQVDWENCNLYFLLETKKLGDVGILLNSTDRNLSITIKNDLPGFKERMEPLASLTKEKLHEVGYNVNSINFTRMSPINSHSAATAVEKTETKKPRPVFTEKGMDFKI